MHLLGLIVRLGDELMTTQLRRSPRLAAAREKAAAPPQPGRMERLLIGDAAPSFALLAIASVSMTLGNKWLMLRPELKAHIELVVVLQNSAAVCVAAGLALLGVVQIRSVSRRQLLYFGWDALVLLVHSRCQRSRRARSSLRVGMQRFHTCLQTNNTYTNQLN